jgi:glycogen synthase
MRHGVVEVLLVGPYPPPYGGLSVGVALLRRLLSESGYICRVLDIGESRRRHGGDCLRARNLFEFVGELVSHAARQYIIHLHTNGHNVRSWLSALACGLAGLCNGRKTAVSIGSGLAPKWVQEAGPANRIIVRATLALTGVILCSNEQTRSTFAALGVPADKLVVLNGFYGLGPTGAGSIPPRVEDFLRRHSPILGALATVGPEYGIPLVAEAASRLRKAHPGVGLLLIGPAGPEHDDLDGALMVTGALPNDVVMAVMGRMGVFVRPTYFDGDACSVREALALGVPVVASDTDFRPDGVVLFRRGSVDDLTDKLGQVLAEVESRDRSPVTSQGSWPRLLAIYEGLSRRASFS